MAVPLRLAVRGRVRVEWRGRFILDFQKVVDEVQVMGSHLVEKVKELIHEGNVKRIIIKNEQGHTLVEIPVTLAAIGVIAAPVLAAVGAIASVVTKCTVVVERREPPAAPTE
jgi:hypothetical protein